MKKFLVLLTALAGVSSSFGQSQVINRGWTTQPSHADFPSEIKPLKRVDLSTQNHSKRISDNITRLEAANAQAKLERYAFRLDERLQAAEQRFTKRTGLHWKACVKTLGIPNQMNNFFGRGYAPGYIDGNEPVVVMLNPASGDGSVGDQTVYQQKGEWVTGSRYRFWVVESVLRCGNENDHPQVGAEAGVSFAVKAREAIKFKDAPERFVSEISAGIERTHTTNNTIIREGYRPAPVRGTWNGFTHSSGITTTQWQGGGLTVFTYQNGSWCPPKDVVCTDQPPVDVQPPSPPPVVTPPNPIGPPRPDPIILPPPVQRGG